MFIAVTILFWIVVSLLVVLAGLLITPVRIWASLRSGPKMRFVLYARPLGGFTPSLRLVDSARKREKKPKIAKDKAITKPEKKRKRAGRWPGISAGADLIVRLKRAVRVESLSLDGEFGLGDPADTGVLFGALSPLIYANTAPDVSVSLRPNFDRPCLSGEFEARLSFVPVALIVPIIGFIWQIYGPGQ